jgi:small subunit ribosomal protein S6
MSEKTKTYEAMFLVDSGQPNFDAASEPIRGILTRRGAEILSLKPWDDRKLAFEIRGRKRGLYILCYFKIDPLQVVEIEHDCRLDERVIRSLFLRKDKLTQETINAETPATTAGHRPPEAAPGEPAPAGAPVGAPVAAPVAGAPVAGAPVEAAPAAPAEAAPSAPAAPAGEETK